MTLRKILTSIVGYMPMVAVLFAPFSLPWLTVGPAFQLSADPPARPAALSSVTTRGASAGLSGSGEDQRRADAASGLAGRRCAASPQHRVDAASRACEDPVMPFVRHGPDHGPAIRALNDSVGGLTTKVNELSGNLSEHMEEKLDVVIEFLARDDSSWREKGKAELRRFVERQSERRVPL